MTRYNYDLQCWTVNGIIRRCEHPGACHCTGKLLEGKHENEVNQSVTVEPDGTLSVYA